MRNCFRKCSSSGSLRRSASLFSTSRDVQPQIVNAQRSKRWWGDSLSFQCTKCGKCCKGRTNVFVNEKEIHDIASFLDMPKFEFAQQYTEEREMPDDNVLTTLKSKEDGGGCIFLDANNACTIYSVRPTQCRTYPFWPGVLLGKAEWEGEAKMCEGINLQTDAHLPLGAPSSSPISTATVKHDTIMHNLVIHQVHARGSGPNFDYNNSSEFLPESVKETPTLISDFEEEFFSTHSSTVLFEDKSENLRVIDTSIPANEEATELETYRRLEFGNSELVQSEIMLEKDGKCNHSKLLFPVHQQLAKEILHFINPSDDKYDEHTSKHIAMIGAGGCTLPMYLSSSTKLNCSLMIDAVELSGSVLHIAREFFQANFANPLGKPFTSITEARAQDVNSKGGHDGNRITAFAMEGLSFLRECTKDKISFKAYDIVVIDVCENGTHNISPPTSFVEIENIDVIMNSLMSNNALLLINVFGHQDWADEVYSRTEAALARKGVTSKLNLSRVGSSPVGATANFILSVHLNALQ